MVTIIEHPRHPQRYQLTEVHNDKLIHLMKDGSRVKEKITKKEAKEWQNPDNYR